MKYTVTAFTDYGCFKKEVRCKRNAKKSTLFRKCMNEIGRLLINYGIIREDARYSFELPNIWTNGYLGCAWFEGSIDVTIQEETGAWLAK